MFWVLSRSKGLWAIGLIALGLTGCNPFNNSNGGEGQACRNQSDCLGDLVCCLDLCQETCDADGDGWLVGVVDDPDCDDNDPNIHPKAQERCNGLNDDCDENIDEDLDQRACPLTYGVCQGVVDICLGLSGWSGCDYGQDYEAGQETRCDDLDNDCDGLTDENLTDQPCERTNAVGTCTGIQNCVGGRWECDAAVPAPDDCDGIDNDCDGQTDPVVDDCPLQQGVCAGTQSGCQDGQVISCDYGDQYQAGPDPPAGMACDFLDNNCDGQIDEDAVLRLEPETGQEAIDGLDNNCNGIADEPGGVMVEIQEMAGGRVWIDAYEATIFDNPDCTGNRYGAAADDYPAEWPAAGPNSIDLYACSLPDLVPSGSLSRWRADRACKAQGKRLCSNAEWKKACATGISRYPWNVVQLPPETCNDAWTGPGEPTPTGSYPDCTPNEGPADERTYDMIGNLAEWVADDHPLDPDMGLVGGWSYSLTICLLYGDNCREAVAGVQFDEDVVDDLSNCIPNDKVYEGFPPTMVRQDFGVRCCMDGP